MCLSWFEFTYKMIMELLYPFHLGDIGKLKIISRNSESSHYEYYKDPNLKRGVENNLGERDTAPLFENGETAHKQGTQEFAFCSKICGVLIMRTYSFLTRNINKL